MDRMVIMRCMDATYFPSRSKIIATKKNPITHDQRCASEQKTKDDAPIKNESKRG
jgi:hypothetical protein